ACGLLDGLAEPGHGSLEADDVRGPVWAGREAQQHELKTGRRAIRYCLSLEDGGGGFRALAEIGRREAALAEVREDRTAHDARAQHVPADRYRDRLADVPPDLAERGCAGRAALQQCR